MLATCQQPENEASCKYELVDQGRIQEFKKGGSFKECVWSAPKNLG